MQEETKSIILSCQFEIITESNIKINGLLNINKSLSTHYLIYRIDNLQNGKHYIGQHQTQNPLDDYMGSGNLIKQAIIKYGIENFVKTILFDFDNFKQMNEKEKELVSILTCYPNDKMSYNLVEGGCGGNKIIWNDEYRNKVSIRFKDKSTKRKGTKLPDYWKEKIAIGMTGKVKKIILNFRLNILKNIKNYWEKYQKQIKVKNYQLKQK